MFPIKHGDITKKSFKENLIGTLSNHWMAKARHV